MVETPVRSSGHGDCPSHVAGGGVDVNSVFVTGPVNCSSNHSAAASFDVGENSTIDFTDLSVVNDSINSNGSVTATNDSANACSDLNVNALFDTTSAAPLNVEVTVAGSVYHSLETVTVKATANSGVNVNTCCDSNIEANSGSNKTAAVTSSENVHSVFKTVNVHATAKSGVLVSAHSNSNVKKDSVQSSSNYLQNLFTKNLLTAL